MPIHLLTFHCDQRIQNYIQFHPSFLLKINSHFKQRTLKRRPIGMMHGPKIVWGCPSTHRPHHSMAGIYVLPPISIIVMCGHHQGHTHIIIKLRSNKAKTNKNVFWLQHCETTALTTKPPYWLSLRDRVRSSFIQRELRVGTLPLHVERTKLRLSGH